MKRHWVTLFVFGTLILLGTWTIFSMSPVFAGENRWDPIGLYGGYVTNVAVDPRNANIIYAGVYGTGLYKSSDGGTSWAHVFPMSGGYATIAVAPTNSSVLYLNVWMSNKQGLYRSPNGGQDWQPITWGEDEGSFCGQAVAVSPVDENLLLAASERGMDSYCLGGADGGNGIYRSADGGATWQLVGSPAWSGVIRAIQFAPSAPYIVYAAGEHGILRSMDSGQSWTRVDTAFVTPPLVYSLAVDPHNAQIVYIGTHDSGMYKTTNGGASWAPIGAGLGSPSIMSILIHVSNQQVLYAGTMEGGVYRSLDSDGLSWTLMSGIGSRSVYALAGDDEPNPNLYAGSYSGIWKYTVASEIADYGVSINEGALFTNQTGVTLTLTAPTGTAEMMIGNDGGFAGADWEPFASSKLWTITSYGNNAIPRIVYAKFRTGGVTSGLYQDDIILDTSPPTGTVAITTTVVWGSQRSAPSIGAASVVSDSIYLPLAQRDHVWGFQWVNLQLSATDDLSGVDKMMVSYDIDFADIQWEPYLSHKTLLVLEAGVTTVYAKFRDRAGNQSEVYSAVLP
jgi:photosystem II stability/assembly factor-like uncharacterized protein